MTKGKSPWGQSGGQSGGGSGNNGGQRPPRSGGQPPELDLIIRRSRETFTRRMGSGNNGGGHGSQQSNAKIIALIALALLSLWLASGMYRVDADEQGVVLRFGKYHRTTEPGLNYHLPAPIESVITPRVTSINREQIGFVSEDAFGNPTGRRENTGESLMLTGDKNLISTQFEVQWRIKNAQQYLFNVRNTHNVVRPVAETAMREVMGKTALSFALSDKRQAIAEQTRELMQGMLDEYGTGIEVFEVNLLSVDAPDPVVDAFIDVLNAQQEKVRLQNEAAKYRDGILPVAEGQARKVINDAEAYKNAIVARARGEAERFNVVYAEYANAKDVTRKRMYYETMQEIFGNMQKTIMEQGAVPYMPLKELRPKNTGQPAANTTRTTSGAQ